MKIAAEICVYTNDQLTVEDDRRRRLSARLALGWSMDRPPLLIVGVRLPRRSRLPGCATTGAARPTTHAAPACRRSMSPPDRVIRTVAGLRPYRAAGFVVRAEALGDKTLVHNYGHGGAGITLSWGTLAARRPSSACPAIRARSR